MNSQAWQQLDNEFQRIKDVHMLSLFNTDPQRAQRFTAKAANLSLDFSKNRIDGAVFNALITLAEQSGLNEKRDAMFSGEAINTTEQRAVLHTALRAQKNDQHLAEKDSVVTEVQNTLAKMKQFAEKVHGGVHKGYTQEAITDVVAIGIGGSFLGPKIVTEALKPYKKSNLNVHFVANVDGHHISDVLAKLNHKTTLVIMSSKSFTTQETLKNTETARDWFINQGGQFEDIKHHFMCVSSNVEKAVEFGIDKDNIFPMWDWVGGRYSLWSAIGLPIILAIGYDNFEQLLAGARDLDQHFLTAPTEQNLPVIMAVLGVWYRNFFNCQSQVMLTYSHYLRGLPAYIQQLDMESNGKSVNTANQAINYVTGPIIWGGEGTNGQHAFHQLMHQSNTVIPADFIMPIKAHHDLTEHHQMLAANCFAQSQALMQGQTKAEIKQSLLAKGMEENEADILAEHKYMPGNRPSNTLLLDELSPRTLGQLIALYEHKVFVQGIIWDVNSFDQWGVELGKVLGENVLNAIQGKDASVDSSTAQLVKLFNQ